MKEFILPIAPFILSSLFSIWYGFKGHKQVQKLLPHFLLIDIILSWITYIAFIASLLFAYMAYGQIQDYLGSFITVITTVDFYTNPLVFVIMVVFVMNLLYIFVGAKLKKYDKPISL